MTESSGDPNAVNPSDPSTGLMGVTPLIGRAYADLKGTDVEVLELLKNLATNMMAGTGFLAHLKFRYGGTLSADVWVQAYNLGETKFDRGARVPDYGERVRKAALTWALGTPI
jgi:soluble lytic murein transglycosylase-like protein